MKKLLPKSINNPQGFTLVELLVVISIIAILSVIGVTIFTGVQRNARDARRRADIDAIAKALEVNRTAVGYVVLAATQFANGVIPLTDPQNIAYCGNSAANTQPADITAAGCAAPGGYAAVSATVPPAGTSWKICAWLEAGGAGGVAAAYCRANAQ